MCSLKCWLVEELKSVCDMDSTYWPSSPTSDNLLIWVTQRMFHRYTYRWNAVRGFSPHTHTHIGSPLGATLSSSLLPYILFIYSLKRWRVDPGRYAWIQTFCRFLKTSIALKQPELERNDTSTAQNHNPTLVGQSHQSTPFNIIFISSDPSKAASTRLFDCHWCYTVLCGVNFLFHKPYRRLIYE